MSSSFRQRVLNAQHFLKDPHLVASLLDRSALERGDVVYDIGAGRGIITEQLALRYKRVVAIEKDPCLVALLQRKFADRPNVAIHAGDFLRYPLPHKPYKVFANIPFNITTAIVSRLTEAQCPPEDAYLAMQREAAEMFLGRPGESLSTLLLKLDFATDIVHHFRREDFCPAPHVDVVLLRLRKRRQALLKNSERQGFRDFVVYSFTSWHPTLDVAFKSVFTSRQRKYIRGELAVDLDRAPAAVSLEQWLALFTYLQTVGSEQARQIVAGSEQHLRQQQKRLHRKTYG